MGTPDIELMTGFILDARAHSVSASLKRMRHVRQLLGLSVRLRRGRRIVIAASCVLINFTACQNDPGTSPLLSSHTRLTGTVTATGSPVESALIAVEVFLLADCFAAKVPFIVLDPQLVQTHAGGVYSARVFAGGSSAFSGCVKVTARRQPQDPGVTVQRTSVVFVDDRSQPPTTTIDITIP